MKIQPLLLTNKASEFIRGARTGTDAILKEIALWVSGSVAVITGIILLLLIVKSIMETRKGHPDAWKDEATKIIVVLILFAISIVATTVFITS